MQRRTPSPQPEAATSAEAPDDLVPIARVVDAYGIRGWVKLESFSGDSPALQSARHWWLRSRDASLRRLTPTTVKPHSGYFVARLAEIDGRDAALALKGAQIEVARADFPAQASDEFYWVDLVGCAVESLDGKSLGQVVEVMDNGAHAILAVRPVGSTKAAEVELVPFVAAFVPTVDTQARRIVVDWQFEHAAGE